MPGRFTMVGMTSKDKPGGNAIPGETMAKICPFDDGSDLAQKEPGLKSLYDIFCRGVSLNPRGDCQGYRPIVDGVAQEYVWMDYTTVKEMVVKLAGGMTDRLGVKRGDKVGIYGKNCPSWIWCQIAASALGVTTVPLYDTLGSNAVEYVINHAELSVVFVELDNVNNVVEVMKSGKCPMLRKVVLFGREGLQNSRVGQHPSIQSEGFLSINTLIEESPADESKLSPGDLKDLFVIMYTSGTTGQPKGVMILNQSVVSAVHGAHRYFSHYGFEFNKDDCVLSFLPLAHIFEQMAEADIFAAGGAIGYYQGDVKKLTDDLDALKPTIFYGVPRVYARFQQKIEEIREGMAGWKRAIFNMALNAQIHAEQNMTSRNMLWDFLFFSKVKAKIFPRVRYAITGSAPLSAETNDFLKAVLNTPITQGYGLSESMGGFICSPPANSVSGHCGGPLPGNEVKLRDVPDMNYLTTDKPHPRGEIMLRGSLIFAGYYKNEEETAKTLDAEGWFATGDIGQLLGDGSFQIIDRRKNLFKLSQGEYVSPEALENEYTKCKLIGQIFVYGNSHENYLVAIVVPDVIAARAWAQEHGSATDDLDQITAMGGFKEDILSQLKEMRTRMKFKGFEEIKDIAFETTVNDLGQGFTVENDLMTPTFKFKRPQLFKKYKDQIDAMYTGNK